MLKTPVSILQEMMVKKGKIPQYHLIHDGGGSHENTFTWSVKCEGLEATGTGRSKKIAKHTAAKLMLEKIADHNGLLALPAVESPVRTPKPPPSPYLTHPSQPFLNAIGALQDLCAENELNGPVYEVTSAVGPPHARVFTVECTVSGFTEEGIATTKKEAKHVVARKMHSRIKEAVQNIDGGQNEHEDSEELIENKLLNVSLDDREREKARNLYETLTCKSIAKKVTLGDTISLYHRKLGMTFELELRQKVYGELEEFKHTVNTRIIDENGRADREFIERFREILEQLNVDFGVQIEGLKTDEFLITFFINTTPSIVEMDFGKDMLQIFIIVFHRAIHTLQFMLR